MHKLLSAITICLLVISPWQTSLASERLELTPEELKQTIELLQACDASVVTCEDLSSAKDKVIAIQEESLEQSQKEIARLRSKSRGSPVLYFVLGALVGGATFMVLGRN
jgi:hypothetical protein